MKFIFIGFLAIPISVVLKTLEKKERMARTLFPLKLRLRDCTRSDFASCVAVSGRGACLGVMD